MLQYPSIPSWRDSPLGEPCIAFKKYDGSNLRWEWSPKKGWNKYGTRHMLFDEETQPWCQAIPFFHDNIGEVIEDQVKHEFRNNVDRITAFTEFFGPSSFAGNHKEDEEKELVLFDVFVFKKGFIPPKQFVKLFGHHDWCARVVYQGNMNQEFVGRVREGKYTDGEGVICKGIGWNAKIKTDAWIGKLKGHYGKDWEKHQ